MTKEEVTTKSTRGRNRGHNKEKVKPPTKVVIRHLPPTMTEEEFLNHFEPLPKHDFYYFAAADWSLGYRATCRAYITLKNYDDVFMLRDQFDGYVFVDSKGAEYPAIVEFAPFQGLVKNKSRRSDNKVNTIEEEPHYQNFLKKLEEDREAATKGGECKLEFTLDRKKEEITSTPLLQYLANKKEKRREEKRRQREEEKEKRLQNQQQITKIFSGGQDNTSGKKAAKDKSAGNKAGAEQQDENKNSRSKRRAERNQRRREQYEQRKREREQLERGEKDKDKSEIVDKEDDTSGKSLSIVSSSKESGLLDDGEGAQKKVQDQKSRKDSKRYSDKRERNSNFRENDKSVTVATSISKNKPNTDKTEETVNESVMNFILNAKEFVPKHIQDEQEQLLQQEAIEYDMLSGDQKSMEKRIRNKDRPSIAIYQPKARLRLSEESDTNASSSKDIRCTSDGENENYKKDEQKPKKATRYSKRREKRLNKQGSEDGENEKDGDANQMVQ